jgi:hypothetical protein
VNITDGIYRDIIMYRLRDYHRKIKYTLITYVCLMSQHYERHCNSYNAPIVVTRYLLNVSSTGLNVANVTILILITRIFDLFEQYSCSLNSFIFQICAIYDPSHFFTQTLIIQIAIY